MASVGQTIIKNGCPDCDGDLIIARVENDVSVLKCIRCDSEYYTIIVSRSHEEV